MALHAYNATQKLTKNCWSPRPPVKTMYVTSDYRLRAPTGHGASLRSAKPSGRRSSGLRLRFTLTLGLGLGIGFAHCLDEEY